MGKPDEQTSKTCTYYAVSVGLHWTETVQTRNVPARLSQHTRAIRHTLIWQVTESTCSWLCFHGLCPPAPPRTGLYYAVARQARSQSQRGGVNIRVQSCSASGRLQGMRYLESRNGNDHTQPVPRCCWCCSWLGQPPRHALSCDRACESGPSWRGGPLIEALHELVPASQCPQSPYQVCGLPRLRVLVWCACSLDHRSPMCRRAPLSKGRHKGGAANAAQ